MFYDIHTNYGRQNGKIHLGSDRFFKDRVLKFKKRISRFLVLVRRFVNVGRSFLIFDDR